MGNHEPSLEQLLDRLRAGDRGAREILLCKYLPHLERVLTRRLRIERISLPCDACDLCQSVARRFLQSGQRFHFDSEQDLFAYLVRVGGHLLERRAREAARARPVRVQLADGQWDRIPDPTPEASRRVAGHEQLEIIKSMLARDERMLLEGRASGQRWRAIGTSLGLSAGAARQRALRLMDRLRRKPR